MSRPARPRDPCGGLEPTAQIERASADAGTAREKDALLQIWLCWLPVAGRAPSLGGSLGLQVSASSEASAAMLRAGSGPTQAQSLTSSATAGDVAVGPGRPSAPAHGPKHRPPGPKCRVA